MMAADWKLLLAEIRALGLEVRAVNTTTGEIVTRVPGVER